MKYRKKPVVIEATQWFPGNVVTGVESEESCKLRCYIDPRVAHVHTLEGALLVSPGDWIITGVNGEHYPCKPDIFEKTYEKVD